MHTSGRGFDIAGVATTPCTGASDEHPSFIGLGMLAIRPSRHLYLALEAMNRCLPWPEREKQQMSEQVLINAVLWLQKSLGVQQPHATCIMMIIYIYICMI